MVATSRITIPLIEMVSAPVYEAWPGCLTGRGASHLGGRAPCEGGRVPIEVVARARIDPALCDADAVLRIADRLEQGVVPHGLRDPVARTSGFSAPGHHTAQRDLRLVTAADSSGMRIMTHPPGPSPALDKISISPSAHISQLLPTGPGGRAAE